MPATQNEVACLSRPLSVTALAAIATGIAIEPLLGTVAIGWSSCERLRTVVDGFGWKSNLERTHLHPHDSWEKQEPFAMHWGKWIRGRIAYNVNIKQFLDWNGPMAFARIQFCKWKNGGSFHGLSKSSGCSSSNSCNLASPGNTQTELTLSKFLAHQCIEDMIWIGAFKIPSAPMHWRHDMAIRQDFLIAIFQVYNYIQLVHPNFRSMLSRNGRINHRFC